ncbi:MAG: hypothetical protein DWQ05_00810 [Calditrichaeota bacterium]|nr:MAG: hypothetical protein DWQ05_00810 [Calditrichota bacterium]
MRYFLAFVLIWTGIRCHAQIKLSEVMFNPADSESSDEFIEIFNANPVQGFDLTQILIGDQKTQENLNLNGQDTILAPNQYAVIFDSDYEIEYGSYSSRIPGEARVLFVADNTIGSAGLSNSTAETILLLNVDGDTLDLYTYSLDNDPGYSDERISFDLGNDANNWGNSLEFNGTPGSENSVLDKQFQVDLTIDIQSQVGEFPRINEACLIRVHAVNIGIENLQQLDFRVVINDTISLRNQMVNRLNSGESVTLFFEWTPQVTGLISIALTVKNFSVDIEKVVEKWIELEEMSLVINEVMFSPSQGEPEWIEIYNRSLFPIVLDGLKIRDASGRQGIADFEATELLPSQQYAVITGDTLVRTLYSLDRDTRIFQLKGFPSLNNTNETLVLLGRTGVQIDSIEISHPAEAGVSLERIRADELSLLVSNWNYCRDTAGATPGAVNSVSPVDFDLTIDTLRIKWEPTHPDRDQQYRIAIPVINIGNLPCELEKWELINPKNDNLIATSLTSINLQPGDTSMVTIESIPHSSGLSPFQFKITAQNDLRNANNIFLFSIFISYQHRDVVINEIMANPEQEQPEWIEIINTNEQDVDLGGWLISDGLTTGTLPFDDAQLILSPFDFIVISEYDNWSNLDIPVFVVPDKWPSLNNDGDTIYIQDPNGTVIDSLSYSNKNISDKGVSLENINPFLDDSGTNNWSFCVSPQGSTPGKTNSLYVEKLPPKGRLDISPNPFSPDRDGFDDNVIISYDLPLLTSRVNLIIFDLRGRMVRHLLNNASSACRRSVIWDGRDNEGRSLNIGIYIVYVQALNASQGELLRLKKTVILAKKL